MSEAGKPKDRQATLGALRAEIARLSQLKGLAGGQGFQQADLRRALRLQGRRRALTPPPAATGPAASHEPIRLRRDLPRLTPARGPAAANEAPAVVLEEAVANGRAVETERGALFEVTQPVAELDGAEQLAARFLEQAEATDSPLTRRAAPLLGVDAIRPRDLLFVDIETTGLTSTPLFLIGVMLWTGTGFEVRQFFARHYAEEAAAIQRFVEECRSRPLLVTFNGKTFDYPYIRVRAAANGIPFGAEPAHLDLLHLSRRIWKGALPNCKLQTLERCICHRTRTGDIPGSEIPEAYHAYVRTQDARLMVEALRHNMLDLVTLADLMTRFPQGT